MTDPTNHTIRYGYDNTGRTTSYTDQNGHTTRYGYDGRGLPTTTTDPDNRISSVSYDLARRLASRTNARGQTIRYGYDNADRLTSVDYPDAPDVTSTLDAAGRPLTVHDGTGTTTYAYDNGGRVVSEHRDLANATFATSYDMLGHRAGLSLTRDGGLTARDTYRYDADGRLSVLGDSTGEFHFAYDAAGRLATLAYPNSVVTTYGYDDAGQTTDIVAARNAQYTSPTSLVSSYHYSYDAVGQRTATTRSVAGQALTSSYGYDQLGRLTSATSNDPQAPLGANASWTYDPAGNRTTQTIRGAVATTYSYDPADQLTTDGTVDYSYDADGNLTSRKTHTGAVSLASYSWDSANRIVGQTGGNQATTYAYDGESRRVSKTDATGSATYLYDGGDLLEELTTGTTGGGDAVETTADGTVLDRTSAAGTSYLHADANGNVGELTDANGTLLGRNAYTPWGAHTYVAAAAADPYQNRHTFAGATGVRDDNNGLIDMRNRMYDPSLGRFLSNDPLNGETQATYRYAGNDPISGLDPYGLCGGHGWNLLGDALNCIGAAFSGAAGAVVDAAQSVGGALASATSALVDKVKSVGGDMAAWVADHSTEIALGAAIVAAIATGGALAAPLLLEGVDAVVVAESLESIAAVAENIDLAANAIDLRHCVDGDSVGCAAALSSLVTAGAGKLLVQAASPAERLAIESALADLGLASDAAGLAHDLNSSGATTK